MNERVENLDIREFLLILKRHLKLIIFLPLFFCCTGFALAQWIIPPRYESQAILVVNAAENSAGQSITYDQISAAQQLVNTYAIIFTSDTVLDQVISSLQLTINAERLAKRITVESINNTEVIRITVWDQDAATAAGIVNEITRVAPDVIIDTVKAGSVEIISGAKTEDEPFFPGRALFTGAGLGCGFVLSVLIALGLEVFNHTFLSGEDVQRFLNLPVIGVIPVSRKKMPLSQSIVTSSVWEEKT